MWCDPAHLHGSPSSCSPQAPWWLIQKTTGSCPCLSCSCLFRILFHGPSLFLFLLTWVARLLSRFHGLSFHLLSVHLWPLGSHAPCAICFHNWSIHHGHLCSCPCSTPPWTPHCWKLLRHQLLRSEVLAMWIHLHRHSSQCHSSRRTHRSIRHLLPPRIHTTSHSRHPRSSHCHPHSAGSRARQNPATSCPHLGRRRCPGGSPYSEWSSELGHEHHWTLWSPRWPAAWCRLWSSSCRSIFPKAARSAFTRSCTPLGMCSCSSSFVTGSRTSSTGSQTKAPSPMS